MVRRIALFSRALLMLALASCVEDEITAPRIQSHTVFPKRTTIIPTPVEQIAFVRTDNAQNDIWVMNPDGTGKTNLTLTASADEGSPSWSPDGTRIVFNRGEEIYVMNADGSGETQLTSNTVPDYFPAWSPTGNQIAFVSQRGTTNQEIYVMNADGTLQTRLTDHAGDDRKPAWSPDGTRIAFYNLDDYDIYTMNADGSALANVTNSTTSQDLWPAWSPDGSKIAFERQGEIFVMSPDGTGQTSLTAGSGPSSGPAWSPDGTRIAFERFVSGQNPIELYVMNADGSSQVNVGNTPASEYSYWPSWWAPTDPDTDNDGIYDQVDTAPATPSANFSDIPHGGATAGAIESIPQNVKVTIKDATAPQGVLVTTVATGSVAANARVTIRLTGKAGLEKLAVPGTYVITDPATSTTVAVETGGPAEVELTLNGSLIVVSINEGASATVTETTNSSGTLTDVTVSDVTGASGDVTVNGDPVEPGDPPVAVGALNAKLSMRRGVLTLIGTLTPPGSVVINPGTSDVTLNMGNYSFVKTGGLTRSRTGAYTFDGTLPSAPGVQLSLELKQAKGGGPWAVKATASPVSGFVNPVTLLLRIGDVLASTQVTASLR